MSGRVLGGPLNKRCHVRAVWFSVLAMASAIVCAVWVAFSVRDESHNESVEAFSMHVLESLKLGNSLREALSGTIWSVAPAADCLCLASFLVAC